MSKKTETNKKYYKIMGANIRQIRVTKGLTQKEFAQRLGVSAITISRIENGRTTFSMFTIWKVVSIFQVSVRDIIGTLDEEFRDIA